MDQTPEIDSPRRWQPTREGLSQWLSAVALGLFLIGPLRFCAVWLAAQQNRSNGYDVEALWRYGIGMALLLPFCAFICATLSLAVRPNWRAALVMLASILFELMAVPAYANFID